MTGKNTSMGETAALTGITPESIRHYEKIGLIPAPTRTDGGRRTYSAALVDRLRFIRHARLLGFSLDDIRALLDLSDDPSHDCSAADSIARQHLGQVSAKRKALEALESALTDMIDNHCHGTVSQCRVIETLADHDLCADDHPSLSGTLTGDTLNQARR